MILACFHLAWRYVSRHRWQTALLAGALSLVLALPLSIRVIVLSAQTAMQARAASTPQIIGARGSALDLLLTALYFKRQPLPTLTAKTLGEVKAMKLGTAVPVYTRFHAQEAPIIGTHLDYFRLRHLPVAQGRMISRLGDCVVGAHLAARHGLAPGGHLFSSQEQVFDLAGIYPLKMRITGVLAANGTPDDDAAFVDVKTTWLIEGIAHGHDDLVSAGSEAVLKQETGNVVGNASVRMFNEVTEKNLSSFHFHGDSAGYPLSAILVFPQDAKSEAILAGRFSRPDQTSQIIRPLDEFQQLMATLFQIETLVVAILGVIAVAAVGIAALVFALSFRLRQREFRTLDDLGIPRKALWLTKLLEILLVCILGTGMAALWIGLVYFNAGSFVEVLLRS